MKTDQDYFAIKAERDEYRNAFNRKANSHEALLEVAKKLQTALSKQWLKSVESDDIEADKNLRKYVNDLYGDLTDAIQQAEGGK